MRRSVSFPFVIASFMTFFFVTEIAIGATITIRVEVPDSTPSGDLIYIAGDFQSWNPGDPAYALTEQTDGSWEITLSLPDAIPIQYKFTRGSWQTVEKGSTGEEIPNRVHTPQGTETINHVVANWADIQPSTITGHVESFVFAPFLGGRRCWVYLPPDYFESSDSYPVLYMHDGQNLFDEATSFAGEWQVDEACESLIGNREIEPIIVVGVENSSSRCDEYTPWADNAFGCGGGGDGYLQAIRDILIPEVNLRYRTQSGHAKTYMAGSSLGGLISVYAGYEYDDVWGRIAGVSPSYWWSGQQILSHAVTASKPDELSRFYQDMGTAESGIANLRAMRDIAIGQGFVEGNDLLSVEAQNHMHNEFYWAIRMPDILRYLIDPPLPCLGDWDCDGDVDLNDFEYFADCANGPGIAPNPLLPGVTQANCIEAFDFDGGSDVDLADFVEFAERLVP